MLELIRSHARGNHTSEGSSDRPDWPSHRTNDASGASANQASRCRDDGVSRFSNARHKCAFRRRTLSWSIREIIERRYIVKAWNASRRCAAGGKIIERRDIVERWYAVSHGHPYCWTGMLSPFGPRVYHCPL